VNPGEPFVLGGRAKEAQVRLMVIQRLGLSERPRAQETTLPALDDDDSWVGNSTLGSPGRQPKLRDRRLSSAREPLQSPTHPRS